MKKLKKYFKLVPFTHQELNLIAQIELKENLFILKYLFTDKNKIISIPHSPSFKPLISDNLWKDTCFEFFFSLNNSKNYYEINISPLYKYAFYHFDDYRRNMKKTSDLILNEMKATKNKQLFELKFSFYYKNNIDIKNLSFNLSSILKENNNEFIYLALAHDKKPDFHNKKTWNTFKFIQEPYL